MHLNKVLRCGHANDGETVLLEPEVPGGDREALLQEGGDTFDNIFTKQAKSRRTRKYKIK